MKLQKKKEKVGVWRILYWEIGCNGDWPNRTNMLTVDWKSNGGDLAKVDHCGFTISPSNLHRYHFLNLNKDTHVTSLRFSLTFFPFFFPTCISFFLFFFQNKTFKKFILIQSLFIILMDKITENFIILISIIDIIWNFVIIYKYFGLVSFWFLYFIF